MLRVNIIWIHAHTCISQDFGQEILGLHKQEIQEVEHVLKITTRIQLTRHYFALLLFKKIIVGQTKIHTEQSCAVLSSLFFLISLILSKLHDKGDCSFEKYCATSEPRRAKHQQPTAAGRVMARQIPAAGHQMISNSRQEIVGKRLAAAEKQK